MPLSRDFDFFCFLPIQLNHPDLVDGLVLINVNPNAEGLMDSVANKVGTMPEKFSLSRPCFIIIFQSMN